MELGAFSVSLAVKDIEASKLFYEKLDFMARSLHTAQRHPSGYIEYPQFRARFRPTGFLPQCSPDRRQPESKP